MKPALIFLVALVLAPLSALQALDYPHVTAEPQKVGWPLTAEERANVVEKPEHERRPGRESNKHLPKLWPQVPNAGHFGGDSWLKLHEAHVKTVQANQGPLDVLLVGDSITIQWGESWTKHFPDLKLVNIGIGGDKTQNVLWRLDHGGVEGLQPKAIALMIGNNNMFFTPETGIEAAALGIQMCVKNLREKFPKAAIIVAKVLPAHAPGNRFYEDIKKTNAALDPLKLDSDPQADIALMSDDLSRVAWLIAHSHRTLRIIRQNIAASLGVKAVFVTLTILGHANLWTAIAADTGVSLAVVFNALRLLRTDGSTDEV